MIAFQYRGEPIHELQAWCQEHGCDLIRFRYERWEVNPFTGIKELLCREEGTMPSLFWHALRYREGDRYIWLELVPVPRRRERLHEGGGLGDRRG